MIDEKRLIEEINKEICTNCSEEYCLGHCNVRLIEELINNQQKVGEWIPCSERLPSENGKYLATGIKGSVYIAEFLKGVFNGKPVSLWCRSGGNYCNVIAWMELPPAYERRNEDD